MTTDRCPGCHAAVTPGAPWCTLCYTDLRTPAPEPQPAQPQPEPQPEPEPQPALYSAAMAAAPQPTGVQSTAVQSTAVLPPDPILDAPIIQAAPIARRGLAGWPCSCGTVVPMADDVCGNCGRSFLPTDGMPSVSLPGIGDVSTMDRGQKIVVTVMIALVVTGLFTALAFIAGSVL